MARRISDDELPLRRGEVAVGDVDRDALFAFGAQAIGEEREVHGVEPLGLAGALDARHGVFEHLLGVVKQPANERALAVIDGAGGGEAKKVH